MAHQIAPKLSSAEISPGELGQRSTEMSLEQIGAKRRLFQHSILEPLLIVSDSSLRE